MTPHNPIEKSLSRLTGLEGEPLDLIPRATFEEKMVDLALEGPPAGAGTAQAALMEMARGIAGTDTSELRVVVLGGGTGLSNIVGGDSRKPDWPSSPFEGLKALFPRTRSIVCVTDDGGSTGTRSSSS